MDQQLFRKRVLELLDGGMSIAELTRNANIKYDIVRDMKRREGASTSIENAEKIANAVGKTLDEFIYGEKGLAISSIFRKLSPENQARVLERAVLLLEEQEAHESTKEPHQT